MISAKLNMLFSQFLRPLMIWNMLFYHTLLYKTADKILQYTTTILDMVHSITYHQSQSPHHCISPQISPDIFPWRCLGPQNWEGHRAQPGCSELGFPSTEHGGWCQTGNGKKKNQTYFFTIMASNIHKSWKFHYNVSYGYTERLLNRCMSVTKIFTTKYTTLRKQMPSSHSNWPVNKKWKKS